MFVSSMDCCGAESTYCRPATIKGKHTCCVLIFWAGKSDETQHADYVFDSMGSAGCKRCYYIIYGSKSNTSIEREADSKNYIKVHNQKNIVKSNFYDHRFSSNVYNFSLFCAHLSKNIFLYEGNGERKTSSSEYHGHITMMMEKHH